MKKQLILLSLLMGASIMSAQEVTTLYFLENAPMRHQINPAFQPVSNGYVNFTPLGYTSMWSGNNSITLSDIVYKNGSQTISALHPNGDSQKLLKQFRKYTLSDMSITMDLLSFGFRYKEKGYIHIGMRERAFMGVATPKGFYNFTFGGGMTDPTGDNTIDLSKLNYQMGIYTEISGGYSHKINDKWTVGGKLKLLLGQAYINQTNPDLSIDANADQWVLQGQGKLYIAGPLNWGGMPKSFRYGNTSGIDAGKLENESLLSYMLPSGYGAAVDLGFTYKPHPQVQITAAINDLGFIYWNNSIKYNTSIDTTFNGVGVFEYKDYQVDGKFSTDSLLSDVGTSLKNIANNIQANQSGNGFAKMINAQLNVGVDANFCNNILGVGLVSKTRMFGNRFYEEVTLGGAVRPCNWFNLALSYSLVNNGKFSNIGAGLSIMPYDGINLTLAMDYIPTSYAAYNGAYYMPYKTKGVNLAFGFSIVWGTNKKKDSDKDGVPDKWDLCPETPVSVQVDSVGCPVDEDGDGVPDYLDRCPGTPKEARGMIDSVGCPIDSDGDGVPDFRDSCFTLPEAIAFVDSIGCDKDSDGDGVPDYRDSCFTAPEGVAFVDSLGCDKDSDGDGVPDYLDGCFTAPEAIGFVDSLGCNLDSDNDEVDDYMDECPHVAGPKENKGCPVIEKEVRTLLQQAMQGIQFETGKAIIKKSSNATLDQIAQVFIANPTYLVEVQGHTDNTGSESVNIDLSQRRAEAVMNYLVKAGVPQERMKAVGYGSQQPIADNTTKNGRAINRRVEFIINFEQISYEKILDHAN